MLKVKISRYSVNAILLSWPKQISPSILNEMTQFIRTVQNDKQSIRDIHHAYHEVLIQYKKKIKSFQVLELDLQNTLINLQKVKSNASSLWTVPALYDEALVPDLPLYLQQKKLRKSELIQLHTAPVYTVYFTGFLPGFLYLGGLDNALALDRKSKPSPLIKKGTVAIGGSQTGVYPQDSPGGWYGIGYTPISFFEAQQETPTWAKTGDLIRFESVDKNEIERIQNGILDGTYSLKSTPYES